MFAVRAPSRRPISSVTAAKMASGGPICATSVATRWSAACSSSRDCRSTWSRAFSSARAAAAMTGTTRSRSLTLDGACMSIATGPVRRSITLAPSPGSGTSIRRPPSSTQTACVGSQ